MEQGWSKFFESGVCTPLIKYGNTETQVSEGGEADLHKHFVDCQKNPGHTKFIPVKTFSIKHLPEGYHDTDLYELIKSAMNLTVRVEVKLTSSNRPEFYPKTNVPYPFYNIRGKTSARFGSGQIEVYQIENGVGRSSGNGEYGHLTAKYASQNVGQSEIMTTKCPCKKCRHSENPSDVWWDVYMATATHVVFDEAESSRTSCRLFFDSEDSTTVTVDDFSGVYLNVREDLCVLKYVTCESLGERLYNMAVRKWELWDTVRDKYVRKDDRFSFIVSHPHGCPKQVSIGDLKEITRVGDFEKGFYFTQLNYTTGTCPGCSGAPVYCVGVAAGHVHSGALDSGLNYSGVGYCKQ